MSGKPREMRAIDGGDVVSFNQFIDQGDGR